MPISNALPSRTKADKHDSTKDDDCRDADRRRCESGRWYERVIGCDGHRRWHDDRDNDEGESCGRCVAPVS
jgi:hypothetical protein